MSSISAGDFPARGTSTCVPSTVRERGSTLDVVESKCSGFFFVERTLGRGGICEDRMSKNKQQKQRISSKAKLDCMNAHLLKKWGKVRFESTAPFLLPVRLETHGDGRGGSGLRSPPETAPPRAFLNVRARAKMAAVKKRAE